MAHRFRVVPLALAALTGTATAQSPAYEPEGTVSASPGSDETGAPPVGGVPGELNADGVYTVKSGDTLWDLSQQFLSNPWYWPKIWADNPVVENPHWIYPGNALRIRFNAEGLPAEIVPVETEVALARPVEVADFSTGSFDRTDLLGQAGDLVSFSGRGRIGLGAPDELKVRVQSIVTSRELAETGLIDASFEQKELLSTFDRVYIRFEEGAKPRVGEKFSIFRTRSEIIHPVSKAKWGHHTEIMGTLRIVGYEKNVAIGEIGDVSDYVVRGDRVGPAAVLDKVVRPTAATADVSSVVLTTEIPRLIEIGESHVVFLDKGAKAGVAEGNVFTVLHEGDGLERLSLGDVALGGKGDMPSEPVATLVVFDVRDDASAAMVVKSLREVKIGDRAEMRAQPILGAAR